MTNKVIKHLFEVSEIDKEASSFKIQKKEAEAKRDEHGSVVAALREEADGLKAVLEQKKQFVASEESKLSAEQQRIVDRRKALTGLGGAKAAKLIEREIDIATRALQSLEEAVSRSVEEADNAADRLEQVKDALAEKEQEFEEMLPELEEAIAAATKELDSLDKKRGTVLSKLDDRLRNLYERVSSRYAGDAVAPAQKGSCRACYRALPAQTYNQILAGNMLIQCPGCSRILFHQETPGVDE